MTVPLAEQISWADRQHMYAETDLRNSPNSSDYDVQCSAAVLATLESVPAMLAVIEAARLTADRLEREFRHDNDLRHLRDNIRHALAALPSPLQEES